MDELRTQDKDLSTLGISEAMIKKHFGHVTEWHSHAKIEHGRATHKVQYVDVSYAPIPFSCAPMAALCDSPRSDNF